MSFGAKTIQFIDRNLKEELRKELADQGHHLTGALEDSITSQFQFGNTTALEVYANDYINPVNDGVPASNIPFDSSVKSGATSSKYIEGLKNYARLRFGITNEKEALSAAFAIAKKHEKEGMPTAGSYAHSKNQRRTEAMQETFNNKELDQNIEKGLSQELDELLGVKSTIII